MLWMVLILIVLIFLCLALALKYLVFNETVNNATNESTNKSAEEVKSDKKVVILLTFRVIFSFILLLLCYVYLSS